MCNTITALYLNSSNRAISHDKIKFLNIPLRKILVFSQRNNYFPPQEAKSKKAKNFMNNRDALSYLDLSADNYCFIYIFYYVLLIVFYTFLIILYTFSCLQNCAPNKFLFTVLKLNRKWQHRVIKLKVNFIYKKF